MLRQLFLPHVGVPANVPIFNAALSLFIKFPAAVGENANGSNDKTSESK
jgi:hypothetical protein